MQKFCRNPQKNISDRIYDAINDISEHYIRPIQRVKNSSNKETFLYEVYDCDDDLIRDLKHSTQGYMENALKALSNEGAESAAKYFDKVLSIFPDDPVSLYYKKIFEKINSR